MSGVRWQGPLVLAAVVCAHVAHTVLGIPVEGIEQVLVGMFQTR